jgi:hypothetical protein
MITFRMYTASHDRLNHARYGTPSSIRGGCLRSLAPLLASCARQSCTPTPADGSTLLDNLPTKYHAAALTVRLMQRCESAGKCCA